jgi:hypothetical protein
MEKSKQYSCPNCETNAPVPDPDALEWPFCGEACYSEYAKTNYHQTNEDGKPVYSIAEMQEKFLQMGREVKT